MWHIRLWKCSVFCGVFGIVIEVIVVGTDVEVVVVVAVDIPGRVCEDLAAVDIGWFISCYCRMMLLVRMLSRSFNS